MLQTNQLQNSSGVNRDWTYRLLHQAAVSKERGPQLRRSPGRISSKRLSARSERDLHWSEQLFASATRGLFARNKLMVTVDRKNICEFQFRANQYEVCFGSHHKADVVLNWPKVSPFQARISCRNGQFQLEDLGSEHGTYLDGKKVSSGGTVELYDGAEHKQHPSETIDTEILESCANGFPTATTPSRRSTHWALPHPQGWLRPLHWIYSSEKKKRDRLAREQRLQRVEQEPGELMGKLNSRYLKSEKQIIERVTKLLEYHRVSDFYHITITPVQESRTHQVGKKRLGEDTRYKTTVTTIYSLAWTRNQQVLEQEKNVDGIFPILCTDETMSAKEALLAYKYQPRLEKRFEQMKSVHRAAPTLFKKVERVEAMMFLFFIALIIQAVIERGVRRTMDDQAIDAIPTYPEHRLVYHPTMAKIFDRFHNTSLYQVVNRKKVTKQYQDGLAPVQQSVLELLGMTEASYWTNVTR